MSSGDKIETQNKPLLQASYEWRIGWTVSPSNLLDNMFFSLKHILIHMTEMKESNFKIKSKN